MDVDQVQKEVKRRFENGVDFLKSVPAEMRTNKLWQLTANDTARNVSVGFVAGLALSLIFFRRGGGLRGLTIGLGMGAGIGVSYERANQRFVALQSIQKKRPPVAKDVGGKGKDSDGRQ